MSTQPEALRLADEIEGDYDPDWLYEIGVDEIAAELRRLSKVEAQRDALLEALKRAEPLLIGPILLQTRAAIKAVEGEKT